VARGTDPAGPLAEDNAFCGRRWATTTVDTTFENPLIKTKSSRYLRRLPPVVKRVDRELWAGRSRLLILGVRLSEG